MCRKILPCLLMKVLLKTIFSQQATYVGKGNSCGFWIMGGTSFFITFILHTYPPSLTAFLISYVHPVTPKAYFRITKGIYF